jgi:ribonuclease HI
VSDSKVALGFADGSFSPSKNKDIAEELRNLAVSTGTKTRWVPGHSGDRWNEVCDRLAKKGKLENSGGQNGG